MRERVQSILEKALAERQSRLSEAETALREATVMRDQKLAIVNAIKAEIADIKADLPTPPNGPLA